MKSRPLIEVVWEDATTRTCEIGEDDCPHEHGVVAHSVGWKLKSDKERVVITSLRWQDGRCADRQIIPRGCIWFIRKLGEIG